MKRILLPALLAGLSALGATAHATDGTINFNGSVIGTTCKITVGGTVAPAAATVTLAQTGDSTLNVAGKIAMPTPFDMVLTNCTATGKVSAYFETGTGVDTTTGLLKNTGTATNVELQLYDNAIGNTATIKAGQTQTASTRVQVVGGGATLKYGVQYYATGAATVGTVKGSVTYSIAYE